MKIAIVSIHRYPNGDAGSVRAHAWVNLLHKLGADTMVVGLGPCTNFEVREYDGSSYVSFRANKNDFAHRLANLLLYRKRLAKFLKQKKYDAIIVVDIPFPALFWLKAFAKKHHIRLLHDCVEWYSPEQFSRGKYSLQYWMKNQYNTSWIDEQFSVIAISKYLEDHFNNRGILAARIPVIMDIASLSCEKQTCNDKIVLLYAGSPGKKDYLKEIIEGLAQLSDEEGAKVELRLVGITEEQLAPLCDVDPAAIQRIQGSLRAMGRIPREEVLKQLEEAHFTVLLRSAELRYAKAGFPTKVVESLASATPVILNLTSDLGLYIRDGENGMIVPECSSGAFAATLRRVLALSDDERSEMQAAARRCAEENFDYRLYTKEIETLLGAGEA